MAATPQTEPSLDFAKLYVWIKGVESKVNALLREVEVLKNDVLKKQMDLKKEGKTLTEELLELRREQQKSGEKMDLVIKELKQTAGAEEVLALKKYIDLWNPLNFVTQRDIERLVEQKLSAAEKTSAGATISDEAKAEQTNKKEKHLPFN